MGKRWNFDRDWRFFLGDLAPADETEGWGGAKARAYSFGATAMKLNDGNWRQVELPHDFVVEGDFVNKRSTASDMQRIPEMESIDSRHFAGGCLEGGVAWYRKRFSLPEDCTDRRVFLHFDGIYRNSTVYLNEYYVGSHKSGYTEFSYDITDFINLQEENVLAVRVDARGREGWWYEGGGIYRHVWLEIRENTYIETNGVYTCAQVDSGAGTAVLTVETTVENKILSDREVSICCSVLDREGTRISQSTKPLVLPAWDKGCTVQQSSLSEIHLWSPEDPYLYRIQVTLLDGERELDSQTVEFGFRQMHFDPEQGFFLNGKNLKLKGLCCHHDHAGVGIGIPDSLWEYRIARMKEMGMNAYRSAHYPASPQLLSICDRMGILFFDETRRMSAAEEDLEKLRTMIKSHRNHPCIFLWGIGNEEIFSQDRPEMARATVTMRMAVRQLDSTRPITSAVVCWNGVERFDNAADYVNVTKELDVMGFNYCVPAWDDYHERMPRQPIIITEASSNSSTRGCYETREEIGQYYILDPANSTKCKSGKKAEKQDKAEGEWKYFAERPYLSGIFLWTGIDYRGEPTPMAYPAVYSQFGILDACGFAKDNFYYYKSWWTDEPVLHVFPHWNHPGREGQEFAVYAYSNLEEVEILVNGKSYGRKSMEPNWYLSWTGVVYQPGELKAVGYRDGKAVLTDVVQTTGEPYEVRLTPYRTEIGAQSDVAIVEVDVVDSEGRVVPTADHEIFFEVSGAGELLGVGNGNPGSHESDKLPVRRAFNGKCQLLVRSTGEGTILIKASSLGLRGQTCEITACPQAAVRP